LVVEINGDYIFRFPQDTAARGELAAEHRLFHALEHRVSLAIPRPSFLGPRFCYDGYHMIRGQPLAGAAHYRHLAGSRRRHIAEDLGRFLAELHTALDLESALALQLPGSRDGLLEVDLLGRTLPLMSTASESAVVQHVHRLLTAITPLREDLALLHGDLHGYNLALSPGGGVAGVLDFECATVGDRHLDFRILPSFGDDLLPLTAAAYERWGAAPVDLDRCLIYYAAADLHDLTWRTEQGHEVIGGPIARRVAGVRRRLRKAGLLHA
jgi:aminoglycoside phosphotransferase (APT) family kinase protein